MKFKIYSFGCAFLAGIALKLEGSFSTLQMVGITLWFLFLIASWECWKASEDN